jgi:quercetin dioxygenase-like cupin family protein
MKYKSLSEVKLDIRQDYIKRVLFDINEMPAGGHMLQVVTIPPNTKQRTHSHKIQTEVFYCLEGQCSIFINDVEYIAKPGDAFICEPGDKHNLWNRSDAEFKILVFKIDRPVTDEDTEWRD